MDNNEEFIKRIQATFRVEAEENIRNMTSNLLDLEKKISDSRRMDLIEKTFREVHSLKGSSRAVDMKSIESVCQPLESVFAVLKSQNINLNISVLNVLHRSVDLLRDLLHAQSEDEIKEHKNSIVLIKKWLRKTEAGENVETEIEKSNGIESKHEESVKVEETNTESKEGVEKVRKTVTMPEMQFMSGAETEKRHNIISDNIRVSTAKLDELLFQAEEMLSLKLSSQQRMNDIDVISDKIRIWEKEINIVYPVIRKLKANFEINDADHELTINEKRIRRVTGFLEWAESHIKTIEGDVLNHRKNLLKNSFSTGAKIDTLLEDIKKILAVPFSVLLDSFPKVVRDLSQDFGKEINLKIAGDDMLIDRRILEEMKQPLHHILRNCIDYGIEKPKLRLTRNKELAGNITINIDRQDNNMVEIIIADDGNGIDLEKLREIYIENESLTKDEIKNIDKKELTNYIFKSGVSTNEFVTDISGRGLGLAIVREKIEQLGGYITVETTKSIGTSFKIVLPLSMISFRGVLIRLGNEKYIVPTNKIERIIRFPVSDIEAVENRETIKINKLVIPLVNLAGILGVSSSGVNSEFVTTLVLGSDDKQVGFAIDDVIEEQEFLFKKFNKHLERVRNISGATILGCGTVVPILNASDLLKSAAKDNRSSPKIIETGNVEEKENNRVLVVEDSITSRMLLKNILETAGYSVSTAIDGVDGYTKLKEGDFNALVSDVDMPRMNGFNLTEKVRADKDLNELPVVLVTSLSKREDRERGIEVGANAYLIKSKFEQNNLLDVLTKLI